MITSQRECRRIFREDIQPEIIKQYGKTDSVALNEAWNNWTDLLCKNGIITELAYDTWTRR